ncbi:STAS domain-containing protein [Spirillospora sp. NPDC048911]|uniref:STAS domain-containing protein n=1 Tax=Spirillospora sp. NPDC048911 TaxID=3364527 RepID=UPI00371039E7
MTDHPARDEAGMTLERAPGHVLIGIRGELDIASTPDLRGPLYAALRDPGPLVVIDLSGVTFCDVSGLALLVGARRRTRPHDVSIVLAAPRPQLERLLSLTGLKRAFTIRRSVREAISPGAGTRSTAA